MECREQLLPAIKQRYLQAYHSGECLTTWSDDFLPGEPGRIARKGTSFFVHGKRPPSKFGLLGYLCFPLGELKSGRWNFRVERWLVDGTKDILEKSNSFYNQDGAELESAKRLHEYECAPVTDEFWSWSEIPELLLGRLITRDDAKQLAAVLINLKRKFEPAFYELCMRLGAACSMHEYQSLLAEMEDYKLLDKLGRGEPLSAEETAKMATNKFNLSFGFEYKKAIERSKNAAHRKLSDRSLKLWHELNGYIARGYIFLPRKLLASRLNLKHGTDFRPDNLARWLQRNCLHSTLPKGAKDLNYEPIHAYFLCLDFELENVFAQASASSNIQKYLATAA